MKEVIFEVREDEVDGGYTASALGVGIHTQAETLAELRANVKEAVDCYYEDDAGGVAEHSEPLTEGIFGAGGWLPGRRDEHR